MSIRLTEQQVALLDCCPTDIGISGKLNDALNEANIITLRNLLELPNWDTLRNMRNIGPKGIQEIKECLLRYEFLPFSSSGK